MTTPTVTPPAIVEPAPVPPGAAAPGDSPCEPPADQLSRDLEQSQQTLKSLKRERQITRALFEAGATDLDISAAFIERELAMHPQADPLALVRELVKRMPALFKRAAAPPTTPTAPTRPPASAMSGRPATPDDPRTTAAARARTTGSRTSLLTYMRLSRQPAD